MSLGSLKMALARQIEKLAPKLWMERELRSRPHHFEEEFWLVPLFCSKDKVAIDVGANVGHYSYFMAKFAKKVIAFEPNNDLWPYLHRILGKTVQIEPYALSAQSSKVTMRINRDNTGVSTIEEKNDLASFDNTAVVERVVETRSLDSYNLNDISLIKIDVEGHEETAIAGAHETLQRNRPVLIIESEDRHNAGSPRRLVSTLAELGYRAFYLKGKEMLDFSTLPPEINAPGTRDSELINNFIFIPAEQQALIDRVAAQVAAGATHLHS